MKKPMLTTLRFIIAILAPLALHGCGQPDAKPPHTNIIIVVTDDQRWDELGVVQAERAERGEPARFPFLKTPRLDALASEGMRFRNAFVTTSLCSPSRSTILTGQYAHTHGILDNLTSFSARPTWATALREAGYGTAMIGKWHHGEDWQRPEFDRVAIYRGQGEYFDTNFQVDGKLTPTKGYIDEITVDFAVDYLKERGDKPFAMMVGFKGVHQPFTPMPEHADDYKGNIVGEPPNRLALPPWLIRDQPQRPPRKLARTWWHRLARPQTVSGIDQNMGRLLDALDRLDLAKNTLVIFTSDNGFYSGEHGLGDKRSAYEESLRVPLIARLPGVIRAGSTSDAMVLNLDIAPTVMAFARQAIPQFMQGRSLKALLEEKSGPWRQAFLYENWQENEYWQKPGVARTPSILSVRTATEKLITYPDFPKWTELFDLAADPYELTNLIGYKREQKRRGEMCALLQQLLAETAYVERATLNKWLIGVTDSLPEYQLHAGQPQVFRGPPLRYPGC